MIRKLIRLCTPSRMNLCCVLDLNNARGQDTPVCWQLTRRATASIFNKAPRPDADSLYQPRKGGYRSWDLVGGLEPPQRPMRSAGTGIERSRFCVMPSPGRCACGLGERKREEKLCLRRFVINIFEAPWAIYSVRGATGP